MAGLAQGRSDYYVWEVPGKAIAVHLNLDAIDRLHAEVMRGFGAIPRRGAEVGGVLLGTIEPGNPTVVRVEDFEAVEAEYKRGPSYIPEGEDREAFEETVRRWEPDESLPAYAVGFYRSHTREGLSITAEDLELLEACFPAAAHIALLIKPYATKVSTAGIFFREDGLFPAETALEFPFRRRELAPGAETHTRPLPDVPLRERPPRDQVAAAPRRASLSEAMLRGIAWLPLSFIFLLFGIALGLMISLTRGPAPAAPQGGEFSLGLTASREDENLNVRWDRGAAAIQTAEHGVLEIEDGSYTKSVDLDNAQLKNGSIIYRNTSGTVRFRLVVYPQPRVSVVEMLEWRNH